MHTVPELAGVRRGPRRRLWDRRGGGRGRGRERQRVRLVLRVGGCRRRRLGGGRGGELAAEAKHLNVLRRIWLFSGIVTREFHGKDIVTMEKYEKDQILNFFRIISNKQEPQFEQFENEHVLNKISNILCVVIYKVHVMKYHDSTK